MKNEIDASTVSRDPEVVTAYESDRLVHDLITPRMFTEMQRAMTEVHARAKSGEWSFPVQFYVPLQEKVVDEEATQAFYRALECKDKSERTYPEFFHESFNEPEKEQAFEDLRQWIRKHSAVS
jgi:alpha-beta hydrolase superfamily lysophospholipase